MVPEYPGTRYSKICFEDIWNWQRDLVARPPGLHFQTRMGRGPERDAQQGAEVRRTVHRQPKHRSIFTNAFFEY